MNGRDSIDSPMAGIAGGIVLIAVGSFVLLNAIGDLASLFARYWPLILVVLGVSKLFSRDTIATGLMLVAIGAWFQISHLRLFDVTWRSSWPLLLIAAGLTTIVHSLVRTGGRKLPKEEADNGF